VLRYEMDGQEEKDDILDPPLEIEQGYFGVPEGLNLGIEINEEKTQAISGLN